MQGAKMGIGKGAEMAGSAADSPGLTAFGQGMQMNPAQAQAAADIYNKAATAAVDKAMGSTAGTGATTPVAEMTATELGTGGAGAVAAPVAEVAAPVTAETAGALGAGTAATGAVEGGALAASGAGLGAAAALGTAVPIIGGGLALYGIGDQLGWWADGGEVKPGGGGMGPNSDIRMPKPGELLSPAYGLYKYGDRHGWWADGGEVEPGAQGQTGEVDGPGGPKDDEVLAALSDGEFVMPVGAVKYFGIDRLEKMRQKGLEHEKSMGIA
jgi:hypothetical protein